MTGLLALLGLAALRAHWISAMALTWLGTIVGTLDWGLTISQGIRLQVGTHLGSVWYSPTVVLPVQLVTPFMIFPRPLTRSPKGSHVSARAVGV
jgi:hypothetical protein